MSEDRDANGMPFNVNGRMGVSRAEWLAAIGAGVSGPMTFARWWEEEVAIQEAIGTVPSQEMTAARAWVAGQSADPTTEISLLRKVLHYLRIRKHYDNQGANYLFEHAGDCSLCAAIAAYDRSLSTGNSESQPTP